MAYIKVKLNSFDDYESVLSKSYKKVVNIREEMYRIETKLDSDVKRYQQIDQKFDRIIYDDLFPITTCIGQMKTFVPFANNMYTRVDKDSKDEFLQLCLKYDLLITPMDVVWNQLNLLKTGAQKVYGGISKCVSAVIDNYNEKGWIFRVVKGAEAVVNIVSSVAILVGCVAGTGLTAGLGAVPATLIATYAANSLVNSCADLWSVSAGDVNRVGKTNALKMTMSGLGGQVGKWLGNEEFGKSVGNAVYHVGEVAVVAYSIKGIAGQIKQARVKEATDFIKSDAGKGHKVITNVSDNINILKESARNVYRNAKTEVSTYLDGLKYIATKVDVRDINYYHKQLSKTVPNLTKVVSMVKMGKKVYSKGQSIIGKSAKVLSSLTGWHAKEESSIINGVSKTKNIIEDVCHLTDKIEKIRDNVKVIKIAGPIDY